MNDFGVIEEPTSRALWGSEDIEDDSSDAPTFTVSWLKDQPARIKTFVIVAGDIVSDITERCVAGNAEKICSVNSSMEFNIAAMYKLTADKQSKNETSDVYVLIVSSAVDIALSGKFLDAISDIMALSEKIVAFTNDNILRLHGTERNTNTPTIWRSLSSKEGRECHMSKIPVLRHPNFIAGVAAGAIAFAEFKSIPATVYILYVSDDANDTETAEPMIKLFSEVTDSPMPKIDLIRKTFKKNKLKLYI